MAPTAFVTNTPSLWHVILLSTAALTVYTIGWVVYTLYLHPLSKYPGPRLNAISRLPREYANLSGTLHYKVKSLHEQYGNVLRLSPNELSFVSAQAMKDVYTRHGREGCFPKDHIAYNLPPNGVHSILTVVDDGDHSRFRRLLNHAFSEKALQEQAPLLKKYVDLLMTRLHANASEGPQDMVKWFNWIAFDIIGDLSLGESFGCLEESKYHPWVSFLFSSFKGATFLSASKRFPPLSKILLRLVPKNLKEERARHGRSTAEKVLKRMSMGSERGDFMSNVLRHNEKETGMTEKEIVSTFAVLLLAGSETTATLLSAVTFYLLKNPSVLEKLKNEIRTSFTTEDEITHISVNKLKYQLAVLDEALRIHAPTPGGLPRMVPEGGREIDGQWVPGGTEVMVPWYSINRLETHWTDPDSFVPERWIDSQLYPKDDKSVFAPFSIGPRNCIGRNLAYAEMRLILARLLWNFDLELDVRSTKWADGMKMFLLWEKPSLFVRLTPVSRR